MFFSLSTLLRILAASAASIPFVAAQASETSAAPVTTEQLYATLSSTSAPAPGFNVEGGSVFTNFVNAVNDGQFFFLGTSRFDVRERPGSEPTKPIIFYWCSDLTFSDISNSSLMGLAGRCLQMFLSGFADLVAAGAQFSYAFSEAEFISTWSISAVFAEQLNIFEGQYHTNTDDVVIRYWDDGRKTASRIGWEGHDEGDMHPNAATASWSTFGEITWMSAEEVAQLLNKSVDGFTPDKFKKAYEIIWIKEHKKEAAVNNPNPEAELEIVEEVKNETDSTGETTVPAAPGTAEEEGTDPIEDDSASGRKLASVAARFASAALRVFGI